MSIISFSNKFAFVKTKKVGGTSVQAFLREFLSKDDISAAVTPRDELYSIERGLPAQNYLRSKDDELMYSSLCKERKFDDAIEFLSQSKKIISSHASSKVIRNIIERRGVETAEDFFIFTVERHPYSYLLSRAKYNNRLYNSAGLIDSDFSISELNERVEAIVNAPGFQDSLNFNLYMSDGVIDVDPRFN
tara:strand:- start:307 stop:876 length:570 start_codon:yes stop_codon:yes gene_type:complete